MKPHQVRVIHEKSDLDFKIGKLRDFINEGMPGASPQEGALLMKQIEVMTTYSNLLARRIEIFHD